MNRGLTVGVAAGLGLLVAGAAAWRATAGSRSASAPIPSSVKAEAARPQPAPIPPSPEKLSPCCDLARQLAGTVVQIDARKSQDVAQKSLEFDAGILSQSLKDQLARNPGAWKELIEHVGRRYDSTIGLRVAERLQGAVDPLAESILIDLSVSGSVSGIRHAAVVFLASRDSAAGQSALRRAAQSDPEASVRYAALRALATGRGRLAASEALGSLDEFFKERGLLESDPELCAYARRLSGDKTPVAASAPAAPPPKSRSPFGNDRK